MACSQTVAGLEPLRHGGNKNRTNAQRAFRTRRGALSVLVQGTFNGLCGEGRKTALPTPRGSARRTAQRRRHPQRAGYPYRRESASPLPQKDVLRKASKRGRYRFIWDKTSPFLRDAKPPIERTRGRSTDETRKGRDSARGFKRRKAPENRSLSKDNLGIGLLSHVKMRSIMGDEALNFRVRNGIGCTRFSMDAKEIFQNI